MRKQVTEGWAHWWASKRQMEASVSLGSPLHFQRRHSKSVWFNTEEWEEMLTPVKNRLESESTDICRYKLEFSENHIMKSTMISRGLSCMWHPVQNMPGEATTSLHHRNWTDELLSEWPKIPSTWAPQRDRHLDDVMALPLYVAYTEPPSNLYSNLSK